MKQELFTQMRSEFRMHGDMQKALTLLRLPVIDLREFLLEEIEKNPLLENSSPSFFSSLPCEKWEHIPSSPSLFEKLLSQAREAFSDPLYFSLATYIIGSLDEWGYFTEDLEETSSLFGVAIDNVKRTLTIIQSFDPVGVDARNLQESLLLQIERKNRSNSLAYQIVKEHFLTLLSGQMKRIEKKLKVDRITLQRCLEKEIKPLRFSPLENNSFPPAYIYPDITVKLEKEKLFLTLNEEFLPPIILSSFQDLTSLSHEEKKCVRDFLHSANWLKKSLTRRKELLLKISYFILSLQKDFLSGKGNVKPLKIKDISEELEIHESTVQRGIAGKYIDSPQGVFSLQSLLCKAAPKQEKPRFLLLDTLREIVEKENKESPLSDTLLLEKLISKGFSCSRRTVAKYRKMLHIPSTSSRKFWSH